MNEKAVKAKMKSNKINERIRSVSTCNHFDAIKILPKSKRSFPSDDAVKKTVYLSLMEIQKKWAQPIHNWGLIMNQFILIFENRIQI